MHDKAFSWLNINDTRKLERAKNKQDNKVEPEAISQKNRPQKHAQFVCRTICLPYIWLKLNDAQWALLTCETEPMVQCSISNCPEQHDAISQKVVGPGLRQQDRS